MSALSLKRRENMAAKRRSRRMRKSPIVVSFILIILLACACIFFYGDQLGLDIDIGNNKNETPDSNPPTVSGEDAYFHFIDVGQGDAILVTTKGGNMLIDSGDLGSDSRRALVDHFEAQGVTSFKYAVFTHTDADHIGSADYIVQNYDVENVIMPDYVATTQVYKRLMSAIESKGVNLILIGEDEELCEQSGYTFSLGSMVNTVMAPTEDFDDANEMSIVLKSSFGQVDVLLTGDAEERSEEAMLKLYRAGELDCEILKVGHHGSSSSTTASFLAAVSPEIAVISCGENNKYGHPHNSIVKRLEGGNIGIYRTDLLGTIIIKTNGTSYEIVE